VKNGTGPVKTNQNVKLISTHISAIFIQQKIQKLHKKIISPNLNSKIKSLDKSHRRVSIVVLNQFLRVSRKFENNR
jgi:hypothetical protein